MIAPEPPRRQLKDYLPTGLFARSLLIIVLPVAITQVLITWVFFNSHWEGVSRRLAESVAGNVALVVQQYERAPSPQEAERLAEDARATMRLSVVLQPSKGLPVPVKYADFSIIDRTLDRALNDAITRPHWFDTTRYPDYVDIRVSVTGGTLRFLAYRERVFATTGGIFLLWVIGASALLTTVSILFIRNQVRPILRLSEAAEAFGRGDAMEVKPGGAREVRGATAAFLNMRDRILRHIEQRTNLLASVSHDLRTPLTRLKLQLAMMPQSRDVADARGDVVEMEGMLDEYLAFARGQWVEEPEPTDLGTLAHEVVTDAARNGANVTMAEARVLIAPVRAGAVKRALANLVDNALAHADQVQVSSVLAASGTAEIWIDDNGPGIEPARYEEAFTPFSRLDPSRNQNRKGVGLGLAIARDVARGHGGDLTLALSPLGGLRAIFRVPSQTASA